MFAAILTIHILAAVSLVLIVLLQSGRGAELGAAFGGMGQSTYGRGQFTFISKLTTALAVIFMTTSMSLAFMTTERTTGSVVLPEPTTQSQPLEEKAETAPKTEAPAKPLEQKPAPPNPTKNQ